MKTFREFLNESSPFESSLSYDEKKKLKADLLDVINKLIKKYNGYDQSVNNYIDLTHDTFQTHCLVWGSYITFSARDYEGFKKELTKELKKMNLKPKKFFADRRTVDMDASDIGYYTPAHKEKVCYFYAVSFDVPEKSKLNEGIDSVTDEFEVDKQWFTIKFDKNEVWVGSQHPYDLTEYHFAHSRDSGKTWDIMRLGGKGVVKKNVKCKSFVKGFGKPSDDDYELDTFNWQEIGRMLLDADKKANLKPHIDRT